MEIIYLSLHCHHQNESCIKMGSDESHFSVSLIVRDKVTRQCPQTTTFEEKGEPKRIRTEILLLTSLTPLPLGHTGSHRRTHRARDSVSSSVATVCRDTYTNVCLFLGLQILEGWGGGGQTGAGGRGGRGG